ncbi:hypothetical protein K5Q02_07150 [Pseudomonas sp. MM211]|uniref:hypothetical protein n=1 Tax=Pseudomonas sp. MM211 TaxID=2866808 RepID=UPI001CEDA52D|nr:hypothetical protein [Pseudomonas sp. MM211]UCJ18141.1 hypothetical protein K5Q02_07150 [Pseudomonas sp. MM211]
MRLSQALPGLFKEIELGLKEIGENELASSLIDLEIVGRCTCSDDNCGTFYTLKRSTWQDKPLKHVIPQVDGLYTIDVFKGQLACVEIFNRTDVASKINGLFPLNT